VFDERLVGSHFAVGTAEDDVGVRLPVEQLAHQVGNALLAG